MRGRRRAAREARRARRRRRVRRARQPPTARPPAHRRLVTLHLNPTSLICFPGVLAVRSPRCCFVYFPSRHSCSISNCKRHSCLAPARAHQTRHSTNVRPCLCVRKRFHVGGSGTTWFYPASHERASALTCTQRKKTQPLGLKARACIYARGSFNKITILTSRARDLRCRRRPMSGSSGSRRQQHIKTTSKKILHWE